MIPEVNGVEQRVVIAKHIRNQALYTTPEIFIGFIIIPGFVRNIPSFLFGFGHPFVNHTKFIDKTKFANVTIDAPGRNAGHKVAVIDDAIILSLISVPKITVADSG